MIRPFVFSGIPWVIFGPGRITSLFTAVKSRTGAVLLITGKSSFTSSAAWESLTDQIREQAITFYHASIHVEPTPEMVDEIVSANRDKKIGIVVSIGGGSVIDAGKAVSAMLPLRESVSGYLEGIGTKKHSGVKVPFIAVPTTAGTGSEATKNAVLSCVGENGFKKSLRHDNFIPDIAILDPELLISCPPGVSAACGLDAFTQLLESYVSTEASPLTDSLAYDALGCAAESLIPSCTSERGDIIHRARMAYASFISGVTLANAGLGAVHGFASSIGSFFNIPHGVICGTLVGEVTRMNIEELRKKAGHDDPGLEKYAKVGVLIGKVSVSDREKSLDILTRTIDNWIESLGIPKLGAFGVRGADIPAIVKATGRKNNPVVLDENRLSEILERRI